MRPLQHPAPLRPGDGISIVAPSGPVSAQKLEAGIACIRSLGLEPHYDDGVLQRDGFLAGDDQRRVTELEAAIATPDTVAIWAARGGYGATRLLPRLDLAAIGNARKTLIGFSDITALHALWREAGLSSVHAANVTSLGEWDARAVDALRQGLFGGPWPSLQGQGSLGTAPARGIIAGGNLTVLAAMAGTPHFPDLEGCILLMEDVNEVPYKLDRVLTQLDQAGALRELRGVAVGQLTRCHGPQEGAHQRDGLDVIHEHVKRLGVPMLWGLPIGHEADSRAIPLGRSAIIDPLARCLGFPVED